MKIKYLSVLAISVKQSIFLCTVWRKKQDIPYSSLNNIIHRRTCPTIATLEKLCKGLNITLSDFFDFELYPLQNENLTPEEDELINKYRALTKNKQERLQAYLDGLSES